MEIQVSQGEWISSLISRMKCAEDLDCFLLPTHMHVHAFQLIQERLFPDRSFRVKLVLQNTDANVKQTIHDTCTRANQSGLVAA